MTKDTYEVIIHLINHRHSIAKPRCKGRRDAWNASLHRLGVRKDIEEEIGSVNAMPQASTIMHIRRDSIDSTGCALYVIQRTNIV